MVHEVWTIADRFAHKLLSGNSLEPLGIGTNHIYVGERLLVKRHPQE